MSTLGPLPPPPTAPIVNPVMWAPELPSTRPQNANAEQHPSTAHRPIARPIAVAPLRGSVGAAATPGEPCAAPSVSPGSGLHPGALTPLEVERRAAAVQRSLHPSHHHGPMHAHAGGAGAWLEPHDVEEPLSGPAAQPAAGPATANKAGQQAWGTQNANAEQLPSTAHRPGARPIAATPLRSSVGAAATPGEALSASPGSDLHPGALTPLEVERRAAEVQRTLHPSHHKHPMHAHAGGAAAGAWLEPRDVEEPPSGSVAKPVADPAIAATPGERADPFGVALGCGEEQDATAGGGAKTASAAAGDAGGGGGGDSVDGLGDGSVAEAMEVLEQVRVQVRGQGGMEEKA